MTTTTNQMIAALQNNTTTDNGDLAYKSTKDACVDFFFRVKEGTDKCTIQQLTKASWDQSPKDTLKLIFHLLDVREGKSCNQEALVALLSVADLNYTSFETNLKHIATFGRFKDLLTLLVMTKMDISTEAQLVKNETQNKTNFEMCHKKHWCKLNPINTTYASLFASIKASESIMTKKLKALILDIICSQLKMDIQAKDKNTTGPSLLAKWIPTEHSRLDRMTGIVADIARKMKPDERNTDSAFANQIFDTFAESDQRDRNAHVSK